MPASAASDEPIWIDGALAPRRTFHIDPAAEGLIYGRGLFETTRTWAGIPWLWDRHLARLAASARVLGLALNPHSLPSADQVGQLLTASGRREGVVRLCAAHRPGPSALVWMVVRDLPSEKSALRLARSSVPIDRRDRWSTHKSMNYLARQLAYEEALQVGADDALLLSREGEVLETAHGNIVAKLDQEWVTPAAGTGLLSGTMRQALMEDGELKIREARLGPEELSRAESVFVTNSVRGATEVTRIDTLFEREARGASDLIEAVARTWPAR